LIKGYGQVIVDECHHVSAVRFEEILKGSPAKYKYGLTATLKRKDGKDRIVLMQLGPVRYKDLSKLSSELEHKEYIRKTGISGEKLDENSTAMIFTSVYIRIQSGMSRLLWILRIAWMPENIRLYLQNERNILNCWPGGFQNMHGYIN